MKFNLKSNNVIPNINNCDFEIEIFKDINYLHNK